VTTVRYIAAGLLLSILLAALFPRLLTNTSYDRQFRDLPNAPASRQFPLGTDELGRDRLSRLLYASRISLLAGPAAALLSTVLAAVVGGLAGFFGGWADRCCVACIDLMLSLPWLFLLVIVRALLPLNLPPSLSIVVTFALIAVLGWASAARVIRATCRSLRYSDLVLQARAAGIGSRRILFMHVLPNTRPVLVGQFSAAVPIYILAEANLGLLGLGVADPMPSWGNLLRSLESPLAPDLAAWAPLVLMLVVVSCLYLTQVPEVTSR
jgi:peptide/nickel transport system permease protein